MASQGFLMQSDFEITNKMQETKKNELVEQYILIDWKEHKTLKRNCSLTDTEAHELNYALALNQKCMRYVKAISRFGKYLTKHIDCDNIKEYKIRNNK